MIPYRQAAKDAFIKWFQLSEEEATNKAMTETIESLESQVGAMESIKSATEGLSTSLNLTEEESKMFENAVINGPEDAEIFKTVAGKTTGNENINGLILDDLSYIHDNWVKNKSDEETFNKKVEKQQLRQYAPLEIIGWNEAQSDLLFLEPILEKMNIDFDEGELEQVYHERVEEFIKENGTDFESMVSKGRDFYPALTEELADRLKPLAGTVASQINNNMEQNDKESADIARKYNLLQSNSISESTSYYDTSITDEEILAINNAFEELQKQGLLPTQENINNLSSNGKTM